MSTWGKRKLKTLLVELKISIATVEIGTEGFSKMETVATIGYSLGNCCGYVQRRPSQQTTEIPA